jgi:hypothetical protein
MIAKEIEALIKNTLSSYRSDYNSMNPENQVDFSLTLTDHLIEEFEGMAEVAKQYIGQEMYYLRLAKIYMPNKRFSEKRVIFVAYRPKAEFKNKESANKSMLMECLKSMVIGGLEYSEALKQLDDKKNQEEKEEQKV